MQIIPAILAASKEEVEVLLGEVGGLKGIERVQIDFVDDFFSNQTVPLAAVNVNTIKRKFDAHLMVDPEVVWDEIAMAKINGFDRIIVQVESVDDQMKFLAQTNEVKRGLAVDLETGLDAIDPEVLTELDLVLLMSVPAGFGGQVFDDKVINKITRLQSLRSEKNYKYKICVDGGVEMEHLDHLEELGVDEVAVGVKRLLSWHS